MRYVSIEPGISGMPWIAQPEKVRAQPVQGSDSFEAGFVFASDRPTGSGAESFSEADRAWASERLCQAGLEAWVS